MRVSTMIANNVTMFGARVAETVAEWTAKTSTSGLVVMSVLVIPLIIVILASLLMKPRNWNITKIFISLVMLLYGGFVGGVWVLGWLLGLLF